MSTRGSVAIKKGNTFYGVYNHSDSYPTWLGFNLYNYLRDENNFNRFKKELLNYTDWRDYLDYGRCEYCGQVGKGQPHTISSKMITDIVDGNDNSDFPDKECKYHKHSGIDKSLLIKRGDAKDEALFIEWVYVVDVNERTIDIYTHGRDTGYHWVNIYNDDGSEVVRKFTSPNYNWYFVHTVDIDDDSYINRDKWEFIKEVGYTTSDFYSKMNEKKSKDVRKVVDYR